MSDREQSYFETGPDAGAGPGGPDEPVSFGPGDADPEGGPIGSQDSSGGDLDEAGGDVDEGDDGS
jgi:hypothetical protein